MRITKKITSLFLALCMILSVTAVGVVQTAADTNDATVETYAQETVNGSVILHCFDWSYNNIKAALPDIAKAGYTAVQTSPVQAPKDYNAFWTDTPNQWWKLYQPLGLTIADGNTWLGTKAELKALCTEAEKYGIKVIVDIVANHLANNGSSGGTFSRLNSGVESDLKNSAYIHSENPSSGSARYNTTQINIGMPDLNTGNSYIQQKVLSLLKDCVDCGVDGFRFDAAKHIEVPADDSSFKSNFWPYVINGINEYKSGLYNYGEILNTADIDISNYTQYMSVTDNLTGDRALDKAYWSAASELADSSYKMGAGASKSVLWVESHDTYMGNSGSAYFSNTQSVTSDVLINAWAIVGARADSTALYFARPNSTMGAASSDTTWKSTEVAEVNKFKNHFDGTSEYLSSSGNTAYIERGTKGVVISKLDGSGSVNLTAHAMKSGTYTDQITGNTFTVTGGKISGTVGDSGVAVVYNTEDDVLNYIDATTLYLVPSSKWVTDGGRYAMYLFNSATDTNTWVSMTDTDGDGTYSASVPDGKWTNVIFCRMDGENSENNWDNRKEQTADLAPDYGTDCYTVSSDKWSVYSSNPTDPTSATETTSPTVQPTDSPSGDTKTVYVINQQGWKAPMNIYYWGVSDNPDWPGTAMTSISGNTVYKAEIPNVANKIIFNGDEKQTVNIESDISDGSVFIISSEKDGTNYKVNTSPTYYLVGTMNGWSTANAPTFSIHESSDGKVEYKLSSVSLENGAELKVKDSDNTWYPSGDNYQVTEAGTYDIYFRPNGDGNSDWYQEYIYLNKHAATYTVTWKNGDTVLETDTDLAAGTTPTYDGATPTKESTDQCDYTFSGWSPTVAPVTGDVTYTAQFTETPKTFTIIWKNYNGTVLETDENVPYGSNPSYDGANPTRNSHGSDTYVFTGWAPSVKQVTKDATYTARFTKNTNAYTVTWLDGDGNTLKTDRVIENVMPAYTGATPTKTATAQYTYTYNGFWSPDLVAAKEDKTYTAQFDATVNSYTVTWKNYDGTTLKTDAVEYGTVPTYDGETPTRASDENGKYTFKGWDNDPAAVTGDVTYTAQYTVSEYDKYTIKATNIPEWENVYVYCWTDFGDNSWPGIKMTADSDSFIYSAEIPENAKGIVFTNGDDTSSIKQTIDIKDGIGNGAHWAILNEKDATETTKYKVHAVHDYYLVGTMTSWGTEDAIAFVPHKSGDKKEEYKITSASLKKDDQVKVYGKDNDKWYPDGLNNEYSVTADGDYAVYFRPNADGGSTWHEKYFYLKNITAYTVTWKNDDGTILKTDTVTHGDTPAYIGDTPTKAVCDDNAYTFSGWTDGITIYSASDSMPTVTSNVTYTAVFSFTDGIGARLLGHTLSLKGDIGINFYMELSDDIAHSSTAAMRFTIPKNDTPDTKDIKVSEAITVEAGDKTYHIFRCQVAAKEMTSEITAQIIDGDKKGTVYTYSVKEYADYLLENTGENAEYRKAEPLVKAMLNYGAYAQVYFDKISNGLANAGLSDAEKELGDVQIDIADAVIENLPVGTTYEGSTLSLKSETTLSLYFKSSETLSFSCNGYDVETVPNGIYQVARIRGINARNIGDIFNLNVSGVTVSYSPLNYCKNKLSDEATDATLKDALKAFYRYYEAAYAFFNE